MVPDGDRSGSALLGEVDWRRSFAIGALVAAFAAVMMILTISSTEMPPPGVARGYTEPFLPPQTPFEAQLLRGDAQAYATLALDPTLDSPELFTTGALNAPHFARRPVLPALLWVGSAGQREHLDVASVVLTSIGLGLLVAASAALIQSRGRGQDDRLAVLVLLVPAVLVQSTHMGVEPLALGLALFGLVVWTRRRPHLVLAAALFALATLTRETMVLVPAVLGLTALLGRRLTFRQGCLLALAPLSYVAWTAVVALRYQGLGENESVSVPLAGFIDALQYWDAVDLAVLVLLAVVSVAGVRRDPRSVIAAIIGAYWLFAVVLTYRVWTNWGDFGRVLMPVGVLAVVLLIPADADRAEGVPRPSEPDPGTPAAAGGLRSADERP